MSTAGQLVLASERVEDLTVKVCGVTVSCVEIMK